MPCILVKVLRRVEKGFPPTFSLTTLHGTQAGVDADEFEVEGDIVALCVEDKKEERALYGEKCDAGAAVVGGGAGVVDVGGQFTALGGKGNVRTEMAGEASGDGP